MCLGVFLWCVAGTESETTEFMSVCVQTVQKYPLDDYRSPVFIFERLCSIIYPVSDREREREREGEREREKRERLI